MVVTIACAFSLAVKSTPLTQNAFHEFGTVIENPWPSLQPSHDMGQFPNGVISANQGTALKYQDVTNMMDLYRTAPSGVGSRAVMNMFVCAPRPLQKFQGNGLQRSFPVQLLERHPFTTQTFIPLGLSPVEDSEANYLVIVAPSLSPTDQDRRFAVPTPEARDVPLPGRGLPDLRKLRAFIGNGSKAVTYAAGVWHTPMFVLGRKSIEFVVVQFSNGIETEDCQEVVVQHQPGEGVEILLPGWVARQSNGSARL